MTKKYQLSIIKRLNKKVNHMTYQFHKKHHTIRMEGYDEALVHMGAELDQAKKESYKYGWLNSLTVMKVQKEDKLLD